MCSAVDFFFYMTVFCLFQREVPRSQMIDELKVELAKYGNDTTNGL